MNQVSQDRKKVVGRLATFEEYAGRGADRGTESRALQEIIDVLTHPLETDYKSCDGVGFVRSGEECRTCCGSGKVLNRFYCKT